MEEEGRICMNCGHPIKGHFDDNGAVKCPRCGCGSIADREGFSIDELDDLIK